MITKIKDNLTLFICILLFFTMGFCFIFLPNIINGYDSSAVAYKIETYEKKTEDGYLYYPTYHFRVNATNYKCQDKNGGSSAPNIKKNKVYYNSSNPNKCITQYEKSRYSLVGTLCLISAALAVFACFKNSSMSNKANKNDEGSLENQKSPEEMRQIYEEELEKQRKYEEMRYKADEIAYKSELIFKRVIIGIIIGILYLFVKFETTCIINSIISWNYNETNATFVYKKNGADDSSYDDYIYVFTDNKGDTHEITESVYKEDLAAREIKVKYDENNPQNFYEEDELFEGSDYIWYALKIVIIILLVMLMANEKLLSKIKVSAS